MKEDRESFIFHKDWYNAISQLDKDLRLELYDAIMRKALYNEPPSLSPMGNLAMSFIEPQIERDFDKWLDIREKRSNAGKAHRGNQYSVKEQTEHKQANGTSVPTTEQTEQDRTNGTVSVSVSDDVSVDNNSVILKEKEDTNVSLKKKTIEDAQNDFYNSLIPYVSVYGKEMIRAFYDYWTEPNKSKTKMRFQMEKTWDVSRRLARWEKNNNKQFNNNNNNYGRPKTNSDKFIDSVREANDFAAQLRANIGKQADMGYGDSEEVW